MILKRILRCCPPEDSSIRLALDQSSACSRNKDQNAPCVRVHSMLTDGSSSLKITGLCTRDMQFVENLSGESLKNKTLLKESTSDVFGLGSRGPRAGSTPSGVCSASVRHLSGICPVIVRWRSRYSRVAHGRQATGLSSTACLRNLRAPAWSRTAS